MRPHAAAATAQEQVLRPSKRTWILVLLISAAFVAIGVLILRGPLSSSDRSWAWASSAFFGLGIVISIAQLVPGSSFLRLTPTGITIRTMWRSTFYRWSDIERFGVTRRVPGGHQHMVGMDFAAEYPAGDKARGLMSVNRQVLGFDGALPDNYGWDHAELAEHLNRLRAQYVATRAEAR